MTTSIGANIREVFRKPYLYWMIGIFLLYLTANVIISQFWATARFIPYYLDTIRWGELLISAGLAIVIGALIALNSVSAYRKHQERKKIGKEGAMTCAATIGGFATGICPACVASVFPLIFGGFGIAFSWASLPFNGMEIQLIVIAVLGTSLYLLWGKNERKNC